MVVDSRRQDEAVHARQVGGCAHRDASMSSLVLGRCEAQPGAR